jgi:3-oxoacyl-[acyl-carrier protein] reductase
MRLQGKVALVTGAARGIGRSIAELLADEGADVAVCDLNAEWLAETVAAIQGKGRRAAAFAADVSQAAPVEAVVEGTVKALGRLDLLVNNAGITKDALAVRMSEQDWDAVINVNLKGTFLFSKAAARVLMRQKSGSIVNIASIIGLIGNAGQCNYAASKAGVIALTKSFARELAGRNVRVNAVAPGFIVSKMTDALSQEVRDQMLAAIPMKRFGEAVDVARAVAFLASEDASYLTGQVLSVNGGMVM